MGMDQVQEWRLYPLQQIGGIEVLENMRTVEAGSSLARLYQTIRKEVISNHISDDERIGIIARSGAGKGGLAQGLFQLLRNDLFLRQELARQGAELNLQTHPFAMYANAVKLPRVQREYPDFAVDPQKKQGEHTDDDYRRISGFMSLKVKEHSHLPSSARGNGETSSSSRDTEVKKKIVQLIEVSSPNSYPVTDTYPTTVGEDEQDKGHSVIYNLALDPRTKDTFHLIAINKEDDVSRDAAKHRRDLFESIDLGDYDTLERGQVEILFTNYFGQEVNIFSLKREQIQEALRFYANCMIPAQGIEKSDQAALALRKQLGFRSTTDKYFYRRLKATLHMGRNFHNINNPHFQGMKTITLDYFTRSEIAKDYPELVPPFMRQTHITVPEKLREGYDFFTDI